MQAASPRRVWLTKRALVATVLIVIWVPGCALAAWWQVTVALSGNDLAYLYSVEWPVFAILGVVAWWFRVHDDPNDVGQRRFRRLRSEQGAHAEPLEAARRRAEDEDPELRAYNDYLASLAASAPTKSWRRQSRTAPAAESSDSPTS